MARLQFTPAAERDLGRIWDYTVETWGRGQARRYLREMQQLCTDLAADRLAGRAADEIRPGCRKVACGAHMIYFRREVDRLVVVRILHQSMDVDRHLPGA